MILRLGPRASRGIRPPPVYIALRFKPATLTALWGRGSGSPPGGAQPFQVEPGSRPAAPGVSGGARSDDPNRMSRPTPERALPSQVGGAAEAASAPPPPTGGAALLAGAPTAPFGAAGEWGWGLEVHICAAILGTCHACVVVVIVLAI